MLEAIADDELGYKVLRNKLETPNEEMSKGEWENVDGKISKEQQLYLDGMSYALRIAKAGGL